MFKNFKKKMMPIAVFCVLLFGMAYFPYLPMEIFNIPYEKFSMTMKVIYMLCCDIGFMIVLFILYKDKIINDFKKFFKNFGSNFELSFKYYFIGVLIMVFSNLIIALFFSGAAANNEEAVRSMIGQAPLYMIFSVSIYAPFVEELIFRHSIKDFVLCYPKNKFTKFIYIFLSGFIFATLHVLGQTSSYLDYLYIVPYLSLGIAFASLYYKTDNIFSSIMMHALHNTFTIVLYFAVGGVI